MVFTREDGTYSGADIIRYPFKIIYYELGINFDIETTNITEQELMDLLLSIIK